MVAIDLLLSRRGGTLLGSSADVYPGSIASRAALIHSTPFGLPKLSCIRSLDSTIPDRTGIRALDVTNREKFRRRLDRLSNVPFRRNARQSRAGSFVAGHHFCPILIRQRNVVEYLKIHRSAQAACRRTSEYVR
jgi:hypothetical protein